MNNIALRIGVFAATLILAFALGYSGAYDGAINSIKNFDFRNEKERIEVSRNDAQSRWIKMMEQKNPELHDAIIAAMLISKDMNREIFVLKKENPNKKLKYQLSNERGHADNLLSYSYKNNWFSFDHYNDNDGPWLSTAENQLFVERKISRYYKELNIK